MFLLWTFGGMLVISGVRALSEPNLRSAMAIAPEGQAAEAAGNATDPGGRTATSESGSQNPSAPERLPQIAFLIAGQVRAFSTRDVRRNLSEHLFKAFSGEKANEKIKKANTVQLFYLKATCDRHCTARKKRLLTPLRDKSSNTSGTSYTWSKMEPNRWIAQNMGYRRISGPLRPISAAEFPDEIGSWQGIRSWAQTGHVAGNISFEDMDPDMVKIVDYDVPHDSGNEKTLKHCFPNRYHTNREGNNMKHMVPKFWGMLKEAYKLVESWEERNSMRFDIVVYLRPDLRFHQDLPFTYMDIDWHRDWIWDPERAPDWFWIMPRDVATDALQTLTFQNSCRQEDKCCIATYLCCPGRLSWYIPFYWHRVNGYNLTSKRLGRVFTVE